MGVPGGFEPMSGSAVAANSLRKTECNISGEWNVCWQGAVNGPEELVHKGRLFSVEELFVTLCVRTFLFS